MNIDAESAAYITQIAPSIANPPKCIVKKQYKMTIDAQSAVYIIHFVGLRNRQGCRPIQKASGNFGRRNRSIPCRELSLKWLLWTA